ncbi:MAG: hypothetical protein ACKV2V_29910 [Blastocatellia bacterium]
MSAHQHDVQLILHLYELRRDPEMRAARQWYVSEFNPQSAADIARLMISGQQQSAYYRMVVSYWDMAASFVNNGGIDEKTFLDANTEHMVIFARIEPFLTELRGLFGEPDYLAHLEQLIHRIPGHAAILENRRKLLAKWTRLKAE